MKVEIHMVSPSSSLILWQNRGLIKVKSPKPQHGMNLGQFKQVLQLICSKWLCLYGEGRERPFKNGGSWLVQNGGEAAINSQSSKHMELTSQQHTSHKLEGRNIYVVFLLYQGLNSRALHIPDMCSANKLQLKPDFVYLFVRICIVC